MVRPKGSGVIPVDVRFDAKFDRDGPIPKNQPELGRCWVWTAGRNPKSGYGIFHPSHGSTVTAHRFAYEREYGPLDPGLVPDHLCRNRPCCRPSHLEGVSNEENLRRGVGYRLASGSDDSCIHGHRYTEENTYRNPNDPTDVRCRECARIRERKRAPRGK